jgi:hypothetical protein
LPKKNQVAWATRPDEISTCCPNASFWEIS